MKLLLVVVVLAIVAVLALVFLVGNLLNNFASNLPGSDGADGGIGGECAFLSDADARSLFGGSADAIELSGLYDASIGIIIDKRALPNAPDCWVTDGAKAYIARIARYQGGDAPTVFAAERKAAQPTSQDQGGGITLENPGYFGGDVAGLGDEAFCTDVSPAIMGGVLVRQGDRVIYVSVGPADENAGPEAVLGTGLCDFAQEVARFMVR